MIPAKIKGAYFSSGSWHRYNLWRMWDETKPRVMWVMLNPSMANTVWDDFTTKKCMRYAQRWGYGSIGIVNLFSTVCSNPKRLKEKARPALYDNETDQVLLEETMGRELVIAAWGRHGTLLGRDKEVVHRLRSHGVVFHALQLTVDGIPYHPMNVKSDTTPFLWL